MIPAAARLVRDQQAAWRILLLSLVCCVLEGAVRKWVVGDDSFAAKLAYLSKYLVFSTFIVSLPKGKNRLATLGRPFLQVGLSLVLIGAAVSSASGIEPVGAIITILNVVVLPAAAWMAGRRLPADALRRFAWW